MGKKNIFCGMLLTGVLFLSGCASLPEMTAEQESEIVEYAAGLLMQNMKDYDSRLVDLSLYAGSTETAEETEEPKEDKMDEVADTEKIDVTEGEKQDSAEKLLLPEGVVLTYQGNNVADTYPADGEGEPFFALDAKEGSRLLVLHFTVYNTTEEEQTVNILEKAPKCLIVVNDTEKAYALPTMLLDDLRSYKGILKAGEETELVLIAEMQPEILEQISSIELRVTIGESNTTALLQ